jgi:hypothetical protein
MKHIGVKIRFENDGNKKLAQKSTLTSDAKPKSR